MISREDMFHNKYRFWRRLAFIYRYGLDDEVATCEEQLQLVHPVSHRGHGYTELVTSEDLDKMNIILMPFFSTISGRVLGKDMYEEVAP